MARAKPRRRVKLYPWKSEDWESTFFGYRFIKATFTHPVSWVSRLRVKGRENVPASGPVILAVNHYSWADPVLVGAALHRPAFYLAKEGVFRNVITRKFFEAAGQIKVQRDVGGNTDAVATAVNVLAEGRILGVFPEGTRSRPGQVRRGKTGVARIAALSGAPVVPIAVDAQDFWPRGRALPRLGTKVYVNIGEPMRLELKPTDSEDRERMRNATDEVMDRVRTLLDEAQRAKERGEKWK